jgi:hypothetical protein
MPVLSLSAQDECKTLEFPARVGLAALVEIACQFRGSGGRTRGRGGNSVRALGLFDVDMTAARNDNFLRYN